MEHANRGKQFEKIIEHTLETFGGHTIVKTDPPVTRIGGKDAKGRFTAVHRVGGQCDFEGGFQGLAVCLEAKDCSTAMFLKSRIRTHQWDRLYDTWQMGGISGLLLRFCGEVANDDAVWFLEFGVLRYLFQSKARIARDEILSENAYWLAYGAHGGKSVVLPKMEATLASVAGRLSRDRLRS